MNKWLWPDDGHGLWRVWRAWRQVKWYVAAVKDYPRGVRCGWCGRINFFFDDIGFFCINPKGPSDGPDHRVTCEQCYRGPLGEAHIARFGLGER